MLAEAEYRPIPDSRALVPTTRRGRPTVYSPAYTSEILSRLAEGETLRQVCRDKHLPSEATVRMWVLDDMPRGFAAQYTRARMLGYLGMADELVELSDDTSRDWKKGEDDDEPVFNGEAVARSRLRIDTRKWILAKMLPKVFGDKLQHEHSGEVTVRHENMLDRIALLEREGKL